MMHGREKSDSAIVATKPSNEAGAPAPAEETGEPRAGTKGNADQRSTHRAQDRARVAQGLGRIRQAASTRALPSDTRGRSRMRESRTSGSARGGAQQWASLPRP